MRNAVVTAKKKDGEWSCLYNGANTADAKATYRKLKSDPETDELYLQIGLFLMPTQRRVSRAGRVSEAEQKEADRIKREKAKHIQKELEAKAKADKEAVELAEKEAEKIAKGHVERRKVERAQKAKLKAENEKQKAEHEAKKSNAIADAVVERMTKKKPTPKK